MKRNREIDAKKHTQREKRRNVKREGRDDCHKKG